MEYKNIINYLDQYKDLPTGCKLYFLSGKGKIFLAENNTVTELNSESEDFHNKMHIFINEGNKAHYLLGNPDTNEKNPTNATVKTGITEPHHHFIPHTHGVEHYVYSKGFSGCLLFNKEKQEAQIIKLIPGTLIYISEMVSHSFYNRSDVPLITLIANGGLGINDDKYAITKEVAQRMINTEPDATKKKELLELMDELTVIEDLFDKEQPQHDMSSKEKFSKKLFNVAEYFSTLK